jgi:hypothetical protein
VDKPNVQIEDPLGRYLTIEKVFQDSDSLIGVSVTPLECGEHRFVKFLVPVKSSSLTTM